LKKIKKQEIIASKNRMETLEEKMEHVNNQLTDSSKIQEMEHKLKQNSEILEVFCKRVLDLENERLEAIQEESIIQINVKEEIQKQQVNNFS
jgi:hypothetical protein